MFCDKIKLYFERGYKMKLLIKQRIFSWLDSYDIYNEAGETVYTVKGELALGHSFKVLDNMGNEVGQIKQVLLTFLPKFEIYIGGRCVGDISKELTFLKPKFKIDFNGWRVMGDVFEFEYRVTDSAGGLVASIYKEIFKMSDTYVINVEDPNNVLSALMLVLAIDAEKCSRKD